MLNPLGIKELWEIVLRYSMEHKEDALNKEFRSLFELISWNDKKADGCLIYKNAIHNMRITLLYRHPFIGNTECIWNFKTNKNTKIKLSNYYWWSSGNNKNAMVISRNFIVWMLTRSGNYFN